MPIVPSNEDINKLCTRSCKLLTRVLGELYKNYLFEISFGVYECELYMLAYYYLLSVWCNKEPKIYIWVCVVGD